MVVAWSQRIVLYLFRHVQEVSRLMRLRFTTSQLCGLKGAVYGHFRTWHCSGCVLWLIVGRESVRNLLSLQTYHSLKKFRSYFELPSLVDMIAILAQTGE